MTFVRSMVLAIPLVALLGSIVEARIMAPAPIADRVAKASTVLLGTVTSIEEKGVQHDGTEYKIAIVKVNDAMKGLKDQTHVRVAFQPVTRFPSNSIQKDQPVLLFLNPVKDQPFYTTRMYFDIVNKTSPTWEKEVAASRLAAKVSADAPRYLKSGTPEEKLLAAALLILQYRDPTDTNGKQEPIDPAVSKAILTTLADSDWNRQDVDGPLGSLNGQTLFFRLGITPADGWKPAGGNVAESAKKWLRDNADKYVLKKFLKGEG